MEQEFFLIKSEIRFLAIDLKEILLAKQYRNLIDHAKSKR